MPVCTAFGGTVMIVVVRMPDGSGPGHAVSPVTVAVPALSFTKSRSLILQ